jgi:hypothetical protein
MLNVTFIAGEIKDPKNIPAVCSRNYCTVVYVLANGLFSITANAGSPSASDALSNGIMFINREVRQQQV